MKTYGKELIIDMHNCKVKFSRKMLKKFFKKVCKLINMKREDLHFWDYKGNKKTYKKDPDHLKGITAVQFIRTSNITIHSLDKLKRVYLNIFSCKDFNISTTLDFCSKYFKSDKVYYKEINRA